MADYMIFHNPRCSKSRQSLQILKENNKNPQIFLYLEETLSREMIKDILSILKLMPKEILRKGEADYKTYKLSDFEDDDERLIDFMIKYPKIIERPIILKNKKLFKICRLNIFWLCVSFRRICKNFIPVCSYPYAMLKLS